jgi:uncharacterized protein (DUF2336 family)
MNSLLAEIHAAISKGSPQSRLKALMHTADVLVAGTYNEDQIWLFGEIISKLMEELEQSVRASLSMQLAASSNAPTQVIRQLALDDAIEVAGPALQHSQRVDADTLIETATTKGSAHLLAIARRSQIATPVTDILVRRGNREVVAALVNNNGAEFSENGFLRLLTRTANDSIVAHTLGSRKDIPRHIFQQLIAKASEQVRQKLSAERADLLAPDVEAAVLEATRKLHAKFGPASSEYFQAKRTVRSLRDQGRLDGKQLQLLAQQHKFYEVVVALAAMCDVPAHIVERTFKTSDHDTLLILTKALDLQWPVVVSLLFLGAHDHRMSASALGRLEHEYLFLSVETSRDVLEVYRSRKQARDR